MRRYKRLLVDAVSQEAQLQAYQAVAGPEKIIVRPKKKPAV